MKSLKPSIFGMFLLISVVGCKKNDFKDELVNENLLTTATQAKDAAGWASLNKWEFASQEDFSVFYTTIQDAQLTAEVADNGLVLVFKKDGTSVSALPVEEKTKSESHYWYHQITEGKILISVDTYGTSIAPDAAKAFKYFIITPEKLAQLTTTGHSLDQLMNLNHQEAASLLSAGN